MSVLVDTSVWSEFLRRKTEKTSRTAEALGELIDAHQVTVIGPIRQELLSGIRHRPDWDLLRSKLRAFPDHPVLTEDYELASDFFNQCRAAGIQGSFIDFLICGVASRSGLQIYTLDKDFSRYKRHLPISLYIPPR